ncbi:TolC family protein [Anaerobaca lacustris]|uniref:TolC family protein n=1 Tax=Anaerobaca lacustris TaxID=3044600 RepID=A0AAW6U1N5_9BACT|nr:TolC family protein [Sedimentisphaerales bacterium M17dextr]
MNKHILGAVCVFPLIVGIAVATLAGGCMTRSRSQEPPAHSTRQIDPAGDVASPKVAEPQGAITLKNAIAHALLNSPSLKVFSLETRIADARKLQAGLRPNPELTLEVEDFAGSRDLSGFDASQTTIGIGQVLELAGKREKRVAVAAAEERLAQLDYEARRLDVMNQVTQAFIEVLAAQEQQNVAEDLVQLAEQVQEVVRQRVEAGKDSPVEQAKAQVALSSARITLRAAQKRLASARQILATAWGGESPRFEIATGDLHAVQSIPGFELLAGRIPENPAIERWIANEQARKADRALQKARVTPDLGVSGGLRYASEGDDTAFVVGLAIPLPVFDRNQAGVQAANLQLAQARENTKVAVLDARTSLSEATAQATSALAEATALRDEILPSAQNTLAATEEGYRQGKFDYLSLLDAQRTYFDAQQQYLNALTTYHKAKTDIELLVGRSIDTAEQDL